MVPVVNSWVEVPGNGPPALAAVAEADFLALVSVRAVGMGCSLPTYNGLQSAGAPAPTVLPPQRSKADSLTCGCVPHRAPPASTAVRKRLRGLRERQKSPAATDPGKLSWRRGR